MSNQVAFIGWHEGSAGQIHSWFEQSSSYKVACFVHTEDEEPSIIKIPRSVSQFSYPENSTFKKLPLICAKDWTSALKKMGITKVLVTTPVASERAVHINEALDAGLELVSAIHPSCLILPEAIMGKNVIMHAKSFVGYRAELQDGVILNTGAQVDHHCFIGKCVTIDPGVVMAGNVTIEAECTVHTAVVIKNKITIKKGSIIGAGSVVIRDVDENQTMVGVPAQPIQKK